MIYTNKYNLIFHYKYQLQNTSPIPRALTLTVKLSSAGVWQASNLVRTAALPISGSVTSQEGRHSMRTLSLAPERPSAADAPVALRSGAELKSATGPDYERGEGEGVQCGPD